MFLYRWVAFYKPNSVFVASENFPASLALAVPSNQKILSVSSLCYFKSSEYFEGLGVSLSEDYHADLIYLEEIDTSTKDIILNYKCVIIKKPHQNEQKMILEGIMFLKRYFHFNRFISIWYIAS